MSEENREVHICPILMKTVIWADGICTETCAESQCPVLRNTGEKLQKQSFRTSCVKE